MTKDDWTATVSLTKPLKGTRKSGQHARTALRKAGRRKKPLRRTGQIARRYEEARQEFLMSVARKLFGAMLSCHTPTRDKQDEFIKDISRKEFGVEFCQCSPECPRMIRVWWDESGRQWRTNGHVHHVLRRSARPDLRFDPANLRLVHALCHARIHGAG